MQKLLAHKNHRRRLWGAARARASPIIRMGGQNPFFAPSIIRREFFNIGYFKKNKHENRVHFYILNERCVNFVKKLSTTKKKVVRNFSENRRELFKIFCLKV